MQSLRMQALSGLAAVALSLFVFEFFAAERSRAAASDTMPATTSSGSIAVTNDDHVYVIRGGKIAVYDYSGLFATIGQPAKKPKYIGSWSVEREP